MVKRYYQSLVSLRYSGAMVSLAVTIFIIAFLQTNKQIAGLRTCMMVVSILLAIVMFFYYKTKFSISKEIKKIENVDEYYDGGMVNQSFILEERMLVCEKLKLHEYPTVPIHHVKCESGKYGKVVLQIQGNDAYTITCESLEQAQYLTAFIKRKNQDVVIEGIEPKGSGYLDKLGANYKV